ncbi:response regulator receiver domain-containing protein [Arenibacter algicola]|jgi:CheY-like chemotaxis protein|uniref:Response regulator receiver domain-containing protein n=1 Tax=Arenibacter algicola TaxID=616991 RepID=A0ABY3A7M6_9FLAO|nr:MULTISPECIES: response regulator [Arenibacter]MDX1760164.1 response regulator [Arenibacter algicola]GBF19240.1 response regulator rcp1 [Arenibacter sp. NBRC 103722]|tara:strand:- start:1250 stop:1687 length:438 start_codon:yes stop_codon:yes gene_type:complete
MNPINIFLADDDEDDRELFMDALSELPIETSVKQFENGVDLMAELYSGNPKPDTIFLDLRMPLMDGFECLTDIRSIPELSEIQIIIYSTSFNQNEVDQLKEAGANLYIKKPNSYNQLKTVLYKSLKPFQNTTSKTSDDLNFTVIV